MALNLESGAETHRRVWGSTNFMQARLSVSHPNVRRSQLLGFGWVVRRAEHRNTRCLGFMCPGQSATAKASQRSHSIGITGNSRHAYTGDKDTVSQYCTFLALSAGGGDCRASA